MPWDEIKPEISQAMVATKLGKISVFRAGDRAAPVAIWVRFCNMDHHVPAYLFSGYQVVSIDPPGFGKTPGKKLSTRCEDIN